MVVVIALDVDKPKPDRQTHALVHIYYVSPALLELHATILNLSTLISLSPSRSPPEFDTSVNLIITFFIMNVHTSSQNL